MEPFVTVIIPCFNEEKFIAAVIENILQQDYPSDRIEVFIIDGMSTDRTREIIREYQDRHPYIQMLDNEKRFVPFALNSGIRKSRGEVIVRMDAHAVYPPDYIRVLVKYLFELDADNVGGRWITNPGNDSAEAYAIATALSSLFGVGNAYYRLDIKEIRKTDTVPFGCFRRSVFDRIGMYDEDLLRNQDDELNARIIQNGGRIFLIPEVAINYFARAKIKSLAKMFFQYAYFKPLVNTKLKRPATLRQFVPPLFVLYILCGWTAVFISPVLFFFYLGGIGIYLLFNLGFSIRNAFGRRKWNLLLYLPCIFLFQHLSYGIGYLKGIVTFALLKRSPGTVSSTR
jgi:glycosyltransferase involved in cell wall biosynthesis